MKSIFFIVIAFLLSSTILLAQQTTEVLVSLKTPDGKYIGQVADGGLDASSTTVTAKQTFGLIDLNGGKVVDGDKIKFRFEASQWHEDKEKAAIHRVPIKGAKEEECIFKLRIKGKSAFFETPGGNFVKVEQANVGITKDIKNATSFDIQAAEPPNQSTVYTTAFMFASGGHLGMVAGGGLDAVARELTNGQIFQTVDLNGGKLLTGDQVKLVFGQSQVHEDAGKNIIHRVPIRGATESECIFTIFFTGKKFRLKTPGGKFVTASPDGKSIITTDKEDESSLLTAIPNPTPVVK